MLTPEEPGPGKGRRGGSESACALTAFITLCKSCHVRWGPVTSPPRGPPFLASQLA